MSSTGNFNISELKATNPLFSSLRAIVETGYYANTVTKVHNRKEAYNLAKQTKGVIVTDIPIQQPTEQGLPEDAKVLVFNDGLIVGRTAASRKIFSWPEINQPELLKIAREAMYGMSRKETLTCDVVVGLSEEYMLKSHLLLPRGYENNVLSYMLNFQEITTEYQEMYSRSKPYPVGDIFICGDPDWTHPDYPHGIVMFDPEHNTALVLGLRYFGEFKKGTLTLAWAAAHRNGFIACHGGMKQYTLPSGEKYTMAAYGLSGSGKSTITLAKNADKYDVTVLHDDAFVINKTDGSTTALEPAYFDKTQDYPMDSEAVKYFLTCQNVGITLDNEGKKVLITEDIRNGNGRTVKSKLVTPNRVDHLNERINAVYWIMKDDSLPPIVKITDPTLAAIFGLTLATKRSTAENIIGKVDMDALVIEPFANPFRAYALGEDFQDFKELFEKNHTGCYILNTGFFNDLKVTPHHTLSSIEAIVDGVDEWLDFGPIKGMKYRPIDKMTPHFESNTYLNQLKARMTDRLHFIEAKKTELGGFHALPDETQDVLREILQAIEGAIHTH